MKTTDRYLLRHSRNAICAVATAAVLACGTSQAASVLMISVDGMKPEYVTQADQHGLKLPFLRGLLRNGVHAEGVEGVWPTNTYPSHTTLLTGRTPAEHGIITNLEFDPLHTFGDAWFWYAGEIRTPTLWQAAHRAGLSTASVGWPVSVGALDVDTLIPEYWRNFKPTAELNPADRLLLAALSRPDGLLTRLETSLGPYLMGNDTSPAADETKTRFAIDILEHQRPRFMTVHLSSLDEVEHAHGPFSAEADAQMERIDGLLSRLVAASHAADPGAIAVIVSDHGFAPLTHQLHLYVPFVEAGLLKSTVDPLSGVRKVTGWQAQPWLASGMAAIELHDPGDRRTDDAVRKLLAKLAQDPANGIAEILDRQAMAARGAFPDAAYLVVLKPGWYAGSAWSGPLVTDMPAGRGGHGFAPSYPEMRSAFFAAGPTLAHARNLGVIDMPRLRACASVGPAAKNADRISG